MNKNKLDFETWNKIKQNIHFKEHGNIYPREGQVWMILTGKNIGREQNGSGHLFSRPAIVIKKFNSEIMWVVSLSSQQKPLDFYINFNDPNNKAVSAIIAQLKLVSIKRFVRKLYTADIKTHKEIKQKIINYLS